MERDLRPDQHFRRLEPDKPSLDAGQPASSPLGQPEQLFRLYQSAYRLIQPAIPAPFPLGQPEQQPHAGGINKPEPPLPKLSGQGPEIVTSDQQAGGEQPVVNEVVRRRRSGALEGPSTSLLARIDEMNGKKTDTYSQAGQPLASLPEQQPEQLPHDGGLNAPELQPPKGDTGGFVSNMDELPSSIYGDCFVHLIEYPPIVVKRMVEAGELPEEVAQELFEQYRDDEYYPWKRELLELGQEVSSVPGPNVPEQQEEVSEEETANLRWYRKDMGYFITAGWLSPEEARELLRGKDWDDETQWTP